MRLFQLYHRPKSNKYSNIYGKDVDVKAEVRDVAPEPRRLRNTFFRDQS